MTDSRKGTALKENWFKIESHEMILVLKRYKSRELTRESQYK